MTLKEAIKRIEELERKVKELEARPQHHHYFYSAPVYIPAQPWYPYPYLPSGPMWTSGAGAGDGSGCGSGSGNLIAFNA